MDWVKFRQHVAWRRGVSPTKAARQIAWLESEGTVFGSPSGEPAERRSFGGRDIVDAVRATAERERLERLARQQ
jgi:hypothetical protein